MKGTLFVLLALFSVSCNADEAAASSHPIERVITMLKGLSLKTEMEGKTEAVSYDKFVHWCTTSTKTLNAAIFEEKETIDTLKIEIASEEKEIEQLTQQIAELETQMNDMGQAATEAEALRQKENEMYEAAEADYKSTIAAISEALEGIEATRAPSALTQLISKPQLQKVLALASITSMVGAKTQRDTLASLLQQRPELKAEGDLGAHVKPYNFKSSDVVELLKELRRKFEDELSAATQGETDALNAYALEKQARDAAQKAAQASKDKKNARLGDVSSDLNDHKGQLKNTEEELGADSASLADTKKACAQKQQEWEERSSVRAKELEAMGAAVEILAKASGVRTEAPSNPIPPAAPVEAEREMLATRQGVPTFLQIVDPRQKVVQLLRGRAQTTHSKFLAQMAQELAAHAEDPFNEVNNMIEKMIFHLQDEQTDEDNHKHWCDQELKKTDTSKNNKEDKIEELSLKIKAGEAKVAKLTTDIVAADKMVAEIVAFMAEATEIRAVGKKENALALKDAQDAQNALADAVAVLTSFYKESGEVATESWELLQRGVELPENPATWESGYTAVSDPKAQPAGILTVLEAVASDFSQMEAETRAQESEDQQVFEQSIKANEIQKAERTREAEMKTEEKKRQVDKVNSMKKSKKSVAGELEAVEQYLKDLEPACVQGDSTYEDRKNARTVEIEALREAESILATAFQEASPPNKSLNKPIALTSHNNLRSPIHRHH